MAALFIGIDAEDALLLETLAEYDIGRDIGERVARRFREEGHGARRTRVDLDDINIVMLIDDKLDIVQTYYADAETELLCVAENSALDLIRDGV